MQKLICFVTTPYMVRMTLGFVPTGQGVIRMVSRKTTKSRVQPKKRTLATSSRIRRRNRKPNEYRRNRGRTGCEDEWGKFIDNLEQELAAAFDLPAGLRTSPYYSPPNIVKREVYKFYAYAKRKLKPGPLEDTIDAIRVAKAGKSKVLRTLRKDIKKEPYFWILTGLHLDCPAANLRKPDVTRFAQHLNYAKRHKVPAEYLIGFLMQSGSLSEVYRRAQDPDYREHWFIEKSQPQPNMAVTT
jgi:hypothetical protein